MPVCLTQTRWPLPFSFLQASRGCAFWTLGPGRSDRVNRDVWAVLYKAASSRLRAQEPLRAGEALKCRDGQNAKSGPRRGLQPWVPERPPSSGWGWSDLPRTGADWVAHGPDGGLCHSHLPCSEEAWLRAEDRSLIPVDLILVDFKKLHIILKKRNKSTYSE